MSIVGRLKGLLKTPLVDPVNTQLIFVQIMAPLEPDERFERYEQPLDAELRLHGLGFVSGGGSLLSAPDEEENREILWSGIDVDATDIDKARALLQEHLPDLGCPPGTNLQYEQEGMNRIDTFDGDTWTTSDSAGATNL